MIGQTSDRPSVLIVDDNLTNLRVLIDYLNESGLETLVARSGKGALRQAQFAQPDLILLDVMMPGIDGFETCRVLKERDDTKDIPVIFMTALSDTPDKVRGFRVGAVDYITKPFQQEEVLVRIKTHLTIQRQKKELAELNATKDKFFSIIAHDMKNAFNGLLGFSKIIAESFQMFSKDEIGGFAKDIYDSAQNTFKLLENLLNWARIQRGSMEFNPKSIDLFEVIMDNIKILNENARQKNIRFSHSVNLGTYVYSDPNIINTILRNIISNALKFTPEGGEVSISATSEKDVVEVSVSDTGIGISEENIRKLFRIDTSYKRKGTAGEEGTGLGLILCKELVEKSKGRLWVQSEFGKGTTFRFTLMKAASEDQ